MEAQARARLILTDTSGFHSGGSKSARSLVGEPSQSVFHHVQPSPKIEIPKFDGNNPRTWILKRTSYFQLIPSISDTQKVTLASIHFEGKASQWFQNFSINKGELTWLKFIEIISERFDELKESKIIAEFNKIRQNGSYEEYVEKFEDLKACLLIFNHHHYSEEYFIASFISGLSEELQAFLALFNPNTLQQTIAMARKQILTIEAITKKAKFTNKTYTLMPVLYDSTPSYDRVWLYPIREETFSTIS